MTQSSHNEVTASCPRSQGVNGATLRYIMYDYELFNALAYSVAEYNHFKAMMLEIGTFNITIFQLKFLTVVSVSKFWRFLQ